MACKDGEVRTRHEVDGENLPGGHVHVTAHGGDIRFSGSAAGGEELPGTADLLAAALAACILKNVDRFSKMLRFRYRRATIHVVVEREDPPPRIVRARYTLRVETDEPEARLDLLHRNMCQFGTVTNTIAAASDLQSEIIAVRAPRGASTEPV